MSVMYKIVEGKPPKLSEKYSKELQSLYERYVCYIFMFWYSQNTKQLVTHYVCTHKIIKDLDINLVGISKMFSDVSWEISIICKLF